MAQSPLRLVRPALFDTYPPLLDALAHNGPYRAVIDRVHDGDTCSVLIDLGFGELTYQPVRMQGMNAPELSTPEGLAAYQFALTVIPPGTPILLTVERDFVQSFTRFVCRVMLPDGQDFAAVMIAAGHAVPWP